MGQRRKYREVTHPESGNWPQLRRLFEDRCPQLRAHMGGLPSTKRRLDKVTTRSHKWRPNNSFDRLEGWSVSDGRVTTARFVMTDDDLVAVSPNQTMREAAEAVEDVIAGVEVHLGKRKMTDKVDGRTVQVTNVTEIAIYRRQEPKHQAVKVTGGRSKTTTGRRIRPVGHHQGRKAG